MTAFSTRLFAWNLAWIPAWTGVLLGVLTGCSVYDAHLANSSSAPDATTGAAQIAERLDAGCESCQQPTAENVERPIRCDVNDAAPCELDAAVQDAARSDIRDAASQEAQFPRDAGCDAATCMRAPERAPQTATESEADSDADVDVMPPAIDLCPNDPKKITPGVCGCGKTDTDSDRDGTADCVDGCPQDPAKTVAGACGCGQVDSDSDSDGTPDCMDGCPHDPNKTAPGGCGCAAVDTDSDGDGTPDCIDICPHDGSKTGPGICGCGELDPSVASSGSIYCAKAELLHRYRFDSSGTTATDSVGTANATIYGGPKARLSGGALSLSGNSATGYTNEGYAALPTSLWTGLRSATFEVWIDWKGAGPLGAAIWQRIFDFGDTVSGLAHSYLFLTPDGDGGVRVAYSQNGNGADEVSVVSPQPSPKNTVQHIAVVVDGAASTMTLYTDGAGQGTVHLPGKLSDIDIANLWLGRSHFPNDPEFFGSYLEFRIYGVALTADQVRTSDAAGPDYAFSP